MISNRVWTIKAIQSVMQSKRSKRYDQQYGESDAIKAI